MVELLLHIYTKIVIKFSIDYRLAFKQIENLIKSSLKTIISPPENLPKKKTLAKFFEKAYKVLAVMIFPAFMVLVLQ